MNEPLTHILFSSSFFRIHLLALNYSVKGKSDAQT